MSVSSTLGLRPSVVLLTIISSLTKERQNIVGPWGDTNQESHPTQRVVDLHILVNSLCSTEVHSSEFYASKNVKSRGLVYTTNQISARQSQYK
jgi:hypothetical protein